MMAASWCRKWHRCSIVYTCPPLVKTTPAIAGTATCAADACPLTRVLTSGPGRPAQRLIGPDSRGRPGAAARVGEDIDLDDPPVSDREAHDRKRSSPCGEDDARGAVHQR